jgi:Uma2 family endonuclease
MLLTEKKRSTIEDYERLPEGSPYQLIGGELIMTPSPTPFHQGISQNIELSLGAFVMSKKLGRLFSAPLDIKFSEYDVFQPDIIFVRKERLSLVGREKFNIIPDLVVEILSPSTAYYDLTHKKAVYYKYGVEEYWIVDPADETIEIMVKDSEFYRTESFFGKTNILQSLMFPGFSMKADEVFAF